MIDEEDPKKHHKQNSSLIRNKNTSINTIENQHIP